MCPKLVMDKYSRLLLHFSTLTGNNNGLEPYPNFVKELIVLESPSEELSSIIKEDLPTILPAILTLSVHGDVSVRKAVERTFDAFCNILKKHPSVKNESWWKDMEDKIIAQHYSSKLVKMVEKNDEPWSSNWVFVVNLIVVNSEQVHSVAINSLLKVVEMAFKMSKKNEQIMEKAYYCWNQLIDIFSVHPRVSVSQKLVELFVRPLSTTHLSMKCPELKMKTWLNLMRKIGFLCGNKCKFIIEPFVENLYYKGDDSLCRSFPKGSLEAVIEMVEQKKMYKDFALKLIAIFPLCYEAATDKEMEDYVIKIWTKIIESSPDINKENKTEYIIEIFLKFHKVSLTDRTELNNKLNKILIEKHTYSLDNLRICMQSTLSMVPMISLLMQYEDFRITSFPSIVQILIDNFSESGSKQHNNVDLQIWDVLCESYTMWIKSLNNPEEFYITENDSLSSLLMVPHTYKQWSVVAVQRTWFSLVDAILSTASPSIFLTVLCDKLTEAIQISHINVAVCIEICTHLTDSNKLAFKIIMPTLQVASSHVSPKEPKPLMDLMVLLENAINYVPKNDLTKFVNELMADVNKYEHPWGIRIKTKCTKVLRKLFTMKELNEEQEDKVTSGLQDVDQPCGTKVRSPIMVQSSFLQRLAKAEEKKKKRVPTHASVFGESIPKGGSIENPEKTEVPGKTSPLLKAPFSDKIARCETPERKIDLEKNGCVSSPVIPSSVTIITPSRVTRSRSKSPDPASVKQKRQTLPKARISPMYFDDTAQGEFVIVPPKARTTPLTEHQKEMLSKRRSDIPALYEDLTQDTQSQSESQSIKEIDLLKYIKPTQNQSDIVTTVASELKKDVISDEDKSSSIIDNKIPEPSIDNTSTKSNNVNDKENNSEMPLSASSNESKCYSVDMFNSESDGKNNILEKDLSEEMLSSPAIVESIELVENTPQTADSAISFNVTPTKQPGHPTPRNLVSKINLIEEMEEEEDREKENKIINAKQSDSIPSKRRSTRKSSSKFSSKNPEEIVDGKLKTKKEPLELPVIIIDDVDTPEEKSTEQNCNDIQSTITENSSVNKFTTDIVTVITPNIKTDDKIDNTSKTQETIISLKVNDSDINKNTLPKILDSSINEVKDVDVNNIIIEETITVESASNLLPKSAEPVEENALDDTVRITNEMTMGVCESLDNSKIKNSSVLSEENSESPNSWAMTSTLGKPKTRRKKSVEKITQYSPKQLRSKRLSLTKKKDGAEMVNKNSTEENTSKPVEGDNIPLEVEKVSESTVEENEINTEKKKTVQTSLKIELTPNRKRRISNGDNEEIEEKKKRTDEDFTQDSLIVVKNNIVGKPRKKKVIKSNVKISPNNLEQWLIKSGKTIVKTSLISQENGSSELDTSKIIEDSPDIQINVSESKNIVVEKIEPYSIEKRESPVLDKKEAPFVEMKEVLNASDEVPSAPLMETEEVCEVPSTSSMESEEVTIEVHSHLPMETEDVAEGKTSPVKSPPSDGSQDSADPLNCTLIISGGTSSSEEELEVVRCNEEEVPSTPELEVFRRRRRAVKREVTPARELPSRPQRRAAQMVMMATSDEEPPPIRTPNRRRASIQPFHKTENWPEGLCETWVPYTPFAQIESPSIGILKRKPALPSPTNSPSSSPQVKKKRVSFLDPVVISGLMYAKGSTGLLEARGEVQYANIRPGERPVWRPERDNEETNNEEQPSTSQEIEEVVELPNVDPLITLANTPDISESVTEDFKTYEEYELVQNFLNSTSDAPWSKKMSLELDLTRIADLELCTETIDRLLEKLLEDPDKMVEASEELRKLGVFSVADIKLLPLESLVSFCDRFLKTKTFSSIHDILEEYVNERKTRNKKADPVVEIQETPVPVEESALEVLNKEPKPVSPESGKSSRNRKNRKSTIEIYEEQYEIIREEVISVPISKKGTQTVIQIDPCIESSYPEAGVSQQKKSKKTTEMISSSLVVNQLPKYFQDTDFRNMLASQIVDLPEQELTSFVNTVFKGLTKKMGANCIPLAINLLQGVQKELGGDPH